MGTTWNLLNHHESEARYDAGDLRRNDALASSILSSYPWSEAIVNGIKTGPSMLFYLLFVFY